jgi:hypothetical protein
MWPTQIEVALDYFDEAVKIVRRDVDETLSLLVHKINRLRKDFNKRTPPIRLIGPFDLNDYS